jgi:hypothetical protein
MKEEIKTPKIRLPETIVDETAFDRPDLKHLRLFLYLIPVAGVIPSLWHLFGSNPPERNPRKEAGTGKEQRRPRASQREPKMGGDDRTLSQLSLKLALGWVLALALINLGGSLAETPQLPLLILNSLVTSGYFVTSLGLMLRLKSLR